MNYINKFLTISRQMGVKYIAFRFYHEFLRKSGLMKLLYPVEVPFTNYLSLSTWKVAAKPFFIGSELNYSYSEKEKSSLRTDTETIKEGKILFFTKEWIELGKNYDWFTHPENGFRFDKRVHWSKVKDFDSVQGDIKYVWEKARFTYLLTIIRNDQANKTDNSSFVWQEILSWIRQNYYNCGPHYKCSQELSLRVLNWIIALYYYKSAESLTETVFSDIVNSIYWQTKHVEKNILFSRIAVRNNHAITESLCLFTVGVLFPWFPDAKRWYKKGKKYLEEEGVYQLYEDGSYIQHSFNYQRVVLQLYSFALALAYKNSIGFCTPLLKRLQKSIEFLINFIDPHNGYVPNWGANDSALFFPLNCCSPRDFRPQVNALNVLVNKSVLFDESEFQEDAYWFCSDTISGMPKRKQEQKRCIYAYTNGGYYILKTAHATTFIKCARYKHRPYHADNLHVDIWYDGNNILRDAGTYKYNTNQNNSRFFFGSAGHNTVMLDQFDQMRRGARFIWYNWSESIGADVKEDEETVEFKGTIKAFTYLNPDIRHTRYVNVIKSVPIWVVKDLIEGAKGYTYSQHWNISDEFFASGFRMQSKARDKVLPMERQDSWYSEFYGVKEPAQKLIFRSKENEITTIIYHDSVSNLIGKYVQ